MATKEEDNKLVEQSLELFGGKKIIEIVNGKEKKMTKKEREDRVEIKEKEIVKEGEDLIELMGSVQKIIPIPTVDFEGKSYQDFESMQISIRRVIQGLEQYKDKLDELKDFRAVWDSINRKDDYLTVFHIFSDRIHKDDIPF